MFPSHDTNGYVTLEEANAYVAANYLSTDDDRLTWEAASDADKTSALTRAFADIDMLPFAGRKTNPMQATSFPRFPATDVPQLIKSAQVEHALALFESAASSESDMYAKMWTYGVSSYSIGNLSETFGQASGGGSLAVEHGITSIKAQRLLKPFLNGGFQIGHPRCLL